MRRLLLFSAVLATVASVVVAAVTASASTGGRSHPQAIHTPAPPTHADVASEILAARLATAKFATGLAAAKAAGYGRITPMIPNMGYHYMNPHITGFDLRRPAALVYEHRGKQWQLGALEWVFTSMPAKPPLPGARYGVFGAACHYVDGTFVFAGSQTACAPRSPKSGAAFSFWHPRLVTLHFWVWYPNPSGIYSGLNPSVAPFNRG